MIFFLFCTIWADTHAFIGGGGIVGNFYLNYKKNNNRHEKDSLLLKQIFLDKIKAAKISLVQDSLAVLNNMGVSDDRDINEIMGFLLTDGKGAKIANDFLLDPVIDKMNKKLGEEKYLGPDGATSLQTLLSMNVSYDFSADKLPLDSTDYKKQIKEIVKERWKVFLGDPAKKDTEEAFQKFLGKFQPIFNAVNSKKGLIQKRLDETSFIWPDFKDSGSTIQTTNGLGLFMGQAVQNFQYLYNPVDSSLTFFVHAPVDGHSFQAVTDIKQLNFSIDKIADTLTNRRDIDFLKVKIVVIAPDDKDFKPNSEEIRRHLLEKLDTHRNFNMDIEDEVKKQNVLLKDQDVHASATTFGAEMFAGCCHDLSDKYFVHGRVGLGYLLGDIKATQDHGSTNIQGRLGHFGYADVGMHRWINPLMAVGAVFGVNFKKLRLQNKEDNGKDDAQYLWTPTTGLELITRFSPTSPYFVTFHSGWHFGISQKWGGKDAAVDARDSVTLGGLVTGIRFICVL